MGSGRRREGGDGVSGGICDCGDDVFKSPLLVSPSSSPRRRRLLAIVNLQSAAP